MVTLAGGRGGGGLQAAARVGPGEAGVRARPQPRPRPGQGGRGGAARGVAGAGGGCRAGRAALRVTRSLLEVGLAAPPGLLARGLQEPCADTRVTMQAVVMIIMEVSQ